MSSSQILLPLFYKHDLAFLIICLRSSLHYKILLSFYCRHGWNQNFKPILKLGACKRKWSECNHVFSLLLIKISKTIQRVTLFDKKKWITKKRTDKWVAVSFLCFPFCTYEIKIKNNFLFQCSYYTKLLVQLWLVFFIPIWLNADSCWWKQTMRLMQILSIRECFEAKIRCLSKRCQVSLINDCVCAQNSTNLTLRSSLTFCSVKIVKTLWVSKLYVPKKRKVKCFHCEANFRQNLIKTIKWN